MDFWCGSIDNGTANPLLADDIYPCIMRSCPRGAYTLSRSLQRVRGREHQDSHITYQTSKATLLVAYAQGTLHRVSGI